MLGVVTAAVFSALADRHRRSVLELLRRAPRGVTELAEALGVSQPSASKHLRVLREAGLVRVRPQAQRRVYEIDPAPMAELDAWLAPYRELWSARLDALGARLDATAPDAARTPTGAAPDAVPHPGPAAPTDLQEDP